MKNITLFTLAILFSGIISSQPLSEEYNFLTVIIDQPEGKIDKVIYYPEGSEFEVLNESGTEKKLKKTSDSFTFLENVKLVIYPEYRKERPDYYTVKNRRLRVFTTAKAAYSAGFGADWNGDYSKQPARPKEKTKSKSHYHSNGVTVEKELLKSSKNPEKYNLKMTFSNGIIFNYEDGKYSATLEEQPLLIEHKYIIYSDLGKAKISFNPNNGVVWWVFQPWRTE